MEHTIFLKYNEAEPVCPLLEFNVAIRQRIGKELAANEYSHGNVIIPIYGSKQYYNVTETII